MMIPITTENCGTPEMLFRHTRVDPITGCWLWTRYVDANGYVRVMRKSKKILAHRLAFFHANGYVPEGERVIDHTCRRRSCVNPAHLEDVTQGENIDRGTGATAGRIWLDGVCVNGHVLSEVGLHSAGGRMTCAQCGRDRVARYAAKKKVAA